MNLQFILNIKKDFIRYSNHSVDAGSMSLMSHQVAPRLAPTKEILSFRAYAARRRLNRLRRSACELYHSDSFVPVIRKVEIEVESKRIAVRKEKMIHADLGMPVEKMIHVVMP